MTGGINAALVFPGRLIRIVLPGEMALSMSTCSLSTFLSTRMEGFACKPAGKGSVLFILYAEGCDEDGVNKLAWTKRAVGAMLQSMSSFRAEDCIPTSDFTFL